MITLKRILVPTDFSECAQQALTYATELAKRFEAELHLLHVVPPPSTAYMYGAPLPREALYPIEPAEKELGELIVPGAEHITQIERTVVTGIPFMEIVQHARKNEIDLIVIGTHGRTGIKHMLMGSVAEKVVRKASCPVLSVRPEGQQFVMP
jgi:nucleotide-binding universal stress UspA family protein